MARRIVQFRNYQVNLDAKELFKEGIRVKLEAQPFQVLEALLERPGEIVSREELQKKLWAADTFVDFERGLNTAIRKIRDSLCDEAATPRFVETVPRRGYRFIAPVTGNGETEAPPPPPKRRDWRIPAAAAAVIAITGAAGGIVWMKQRPSGPREYRVTQLTRDIGVTHHPGISGDGHLVVYASDRATGQDSDIWIQHVRGGSPTRLTSSPVREDRPSISADGRWVAYQSHGPEPAIQIVPALGGTPRVVARVSGIDLRISPDGNFIAYGTGVESGMSELRVVPARGRRSPHHSDRDRMGVASGLDHGRQELGFLGKGAGQESSSRLLPRTRGRRASRALEPRKAALEAGLRLHLAAAVPGRHRWARRRHVGGRHDHGGPRPE